MSISFEPIHAVVGSQFTAHTQFGAVELVPVMPDPQAPQIPCYEAVFA